ncbi:hypothetical protein KAW18_04150 [candidate division WOR-3 bacterium]|nr:hypothetical protein [candidate division WOR-3 bacterium]
MKLLKEFKEELLYNLLRVHWRHWSALGVASHIGEEDNWIIDLESLIVSTLYTGKFDKRLLSTSIEWLMQNGKWVNYSRLKRIGKYYYKANKELKVSLFPESLINLLGKISKSANREKSLETLNDAQILENLTDEYRNIFKQSEIRGVATAPKIQKPCLLQLHLRGIFGINARAEILMYFLSSKEGNSNQIAKEIYFDQKIVYRILERWAEAGFVGKEERGKEGIYFLKSCNELSGMLNLRNIYKYINWGRTFYFFSRLLTVLHTEPYSEDEYILSSLFRDLFDEAKVIGRYVNVLFPDAGLYKGASFFSPFASTILEIVEKIEKGE